MVLNFEVVLKLRDIYTESYNNGVTDWQRLLVLKWRELLHGGVLNHRDQVPSAHCNINRTNFQILLCTLFSQNWERINLHVKICHAQSLQTRWMYHATSKQVGKQVALWAHPLREIDFLSVHLIASP